MTLLEQMFGKNLGQVLGKFMWEKGFDGLV